MPNVADLPEPASPNGKEVLVPATRADWRSWLASNPGRSEGAWVVYRKPSSSIDGPAYPELVDEALCFGWIDSITKRLDDDRMIQWFSPRRTGGVWSALNMTRIERLVTDGLMTESGLAAIDKAKDDGSWARSELVGALVVPPDLEVAFESAPGARSAYEALATSGKKQLLWAIYSAKRPETRADRIERNIQQLREEHQ